MGKHGLKGAEIIGHDEAEGGYFGRTCDQAGHHPDYRASVDGQDWSLTVAQTRATVMVQEGNDKVTFPLGMEERRHQVAAFVRPNRGAGWRFARQSLYCAP